MLQKVIVAHTRFKFQHNKLIQSCMNSHHFNIHKEDISLNIFISLQSKAVKKSIIYLTVRMHLV